MDNTKTNSNSTSKQHSGSLLACILKIAAAMNVTLPEPSQAVYLEALTNLTTEEIELATARTIAEWDKPHMMPPVAFILARSGHNPELAAEQAWDWIQNYIRRHWHPDIGHYQGAPEIPAAIDYALRQVGGLARIAYPTDRDIDFIRRGFLDAHRRFVSEGGEQTRLSHADAKRILGTLRLAANSGHEALPVVKEESL